MTIHFRGENGAAMYFDGPVPESIARRIARGDLPRINPDGTPWEDPGPGDDSEPPPAELPPDAPPLPSVQENRPVWTEFAISQGMDRAEANSLTKAQLIEAFSGSQPDA